MNDWTKFGQYQDLILKPMPKGVHPERLMITFGTDDPYDYLNVDQANALIRYLQNWIWTT